MLRVIDFGWLLAAVYALSLGDVVLASPHRRPPPPAHGQPVTNTVDLGYAKYKGTTNGAGVNEYLGIRYAAPPLGDLRWRAPQDPIKVEGIQDASMFQATCIGLFGPTLSDTTNEDCLFLSIFTPSNATTASKLPVWFFIQGGGYAGDTDQNFNGTGVIEASGRQMVFVELNYRVGAFGFLASEKIRKNGDLNAGLLDQRKALEWVQKYIHLFGGDPDHVVIHGDSAGGGSVAYHLTAYGGKGKDMFVGAISESPFLPTHRSVRESEFQFDRFVKNVSCSDAPDQLACLRSLDTATLQSADIISTFPGAPQSPLPDWYFLPVVDGTLSPDYLYRLLEQGRFKRVPTMVANDNDEGTGFAPNATSRAEFLAFIDANYPNLDAVHLDLISLLYRKGTPTFSEHAAWFGPAEKAYGEATLICPGISISQAVAQYVSPLKSWNYRYNVADDNVAFGGVGHVAEKPAIFGVGNENSCYFGCSYQTYNAPIVPIVQNYYVSFVRSLNPNTHKYDEAPEFQPWGFLGGNRLRIQLNDTGMERVPSDQIGRCSVWKTLAPITEQK